MNDTTATSPKSTTKRIGRAVATAVALLLIVSGCNYTPEQERITELVNNSRSNHGRSSLMQNRELTTKAQQWAEHLAAINTLKHSKLSDGVSPGWRRLGENVGYGGRIYDVHRAYMRSSGHRANILSGYFNYIGTGYAERGSRVFTVQVFMQR